jgi:small-conductance mechanosensitive channel
MTIASDPIVSESDTTEREEPLERTTEQTPTIQDLQEDRALPLQNAMSAEMASYWDSILLTLIVIGGTIAFYFIIRYFIGKSADSLNLDRRQLKGIYSITKLILIVIAITIIIFHFSSLSGIAASAISVAAGTIIGFSSRNTISNAIAGILLLSSRPFKIGDRIKIYDLFQAHGLDLTVPQPQVNMGTENRELKEDSEKSHFE